MQIPHTSLLALAGKSPEVSLFDVDSKQIVARIETVVREIHALSVTPDGRFLAVGGATMLPDDVSRPVLMRLASRTCRVLNARTDCPSVACCSSTGDALAIGFRYEGFCWVDGWNTTQPMTLSPSGQLQK